MDTERTDQPIVDARANLSELLASTRLLRRVYFLTSRGKRQVAVVPAELGEQVERVGGPDEAAAILAAHLAGAGRADAAPPTG
ncbi:prevent-host-death family protein [Streptomyces youssoufiensis]